MTVSRRSFLGRSSRLAAAGLLGAATWPGRGGRGDEPSALTPGAGGAWPRARAVDDVMTTTMTKLAATAATVAVHEGGRPVHVRAFGFADAAGTTPTRPEHRFRIASNTKPITRTVATQLIREGKLTTGTKVFATLGIAPWGGRSGDDRLSAITVGHLLDHEAGWDRGASFDPMYATGRIAGEMKLARPITQADVIAYMLARPLQFAPGERSSYSNFGYMVLGRVIEAVTGRTFGEEVQARVAGPLGMEVGFSSDDRAARDRLEVAYPRDEPLSINLRDSSGGIVTTAESLCRFLTAYWISGEPRRPGQKLHYWHTGSFPFTTLAIMEQWPDGLTYAAMFNGRRNDHVDEDTEALHDALTAALGR